MKDDNEDEDDGTPSSLRQSTSQSFDKIATFIKKSGALEKLEFTQGLLNFAHKIEKRFLLEGLLPAL